MESETTGEGNIPTVVTGVDLDAAADHAPVAIVDNLLSHTSSDKLDVDKENDIDRPVQETKHETHKTKPTILELSNNDHRHDPVAVKPCTSLSLELEKDLNHIPTSVSDNNSNTKDFVPKAHRPTEIDKKLNSCNETSSKLPETYGNADSCIHSGSQGNCYDCTNSRTENIVLTDTQSENTNSIIKTGRQTETKDPKNIMSDIENRTNEIKSEMDFNTKLGTLISNDTNKIMLENSTELSVDLNSSLEQKSCSDSSFPTSPLFANGINQGVINFGELTLLLKEYENLKEKHLNLQTEYTTVLEREKYLCAKLNEHDNEGDELCNKLTNVNSELREQLEKMMEELHAAKSENKRLQSTVQDLSDARDVLKQELNDRAQNEGVVVTKLKKKVEELEEKCNKLSEESENAKEKLVAHDGAAKRAITALQKEMTLRVDQVTKMHDDAVREKDSIIVKISKLETDIVQYKKNEEQFDRKLSESSKEIERLKASMKQKDQELTRLQVSLDKKEKELDKSQKEVSSQKEEMNSQSMKVKWAQNKLKHELEAHKETKKQVAQLTAKLQESKEEGEQIRANCQEMIKKYQGSEEMRSVQLDQQLKERENTIKLHEHEISKQDEVHRLTLQELETLKAEHRKAMEEMMMLKSDRAVLEGKLSNHAVKASEYEKQLANLKKEQEKRKLKENELEEANKTIKRYEEQIKYYTDLEARLRTQIADLESELKLSQQKVSELLSYTEKLAENNARWKSQATGLQSKVEGLLTEKEELEARLKQFTTNSKKRVADLEKEINTRESTVDELSMQLEKKQKLVEQLTLSLEEAQDEVKVQKRKNATSLKDLQRQLQQAKKRIEKLEAGQLDSQEALTSKSRTSSSSSLDRLSSDSPPQYASNPTLSNSVQNHGHHLSTEYSIVQPSRQTRAHSGGEIEIDKAVLVDRICRLQKAHAKKNEKIEFMEEHINTLVEDIKKKTKLIQYYVTREEAGTLAPNRFDHNKAQMSRKGGIMASVYSSKASDKDMTLELSLEINRKLQAVVEDTILKNMTLKESISTLGDEIARLQTDMKKARK